MKKLIALVTPLVILFALVPAAQAGKPGSTKVEIKSSPSLYGYVNSNKAAKCAAKRGVSVFKKKSGNDKLIATTRTRQNGGGWQWFIYGRPTGRIYAKAAAKAGCRPGQSKTIVVTPVSDTPAPPCPSLTIGICSVGNALNTALRLGSSSGCPSFSKKSDSCDGNVVGGPPLWRKNPTGNIHWNNGSGEARGIAYYNGGAFLEGSMSSFRDDAVPIRDARATTDGPHFCTPNLPGKRPAERGGPLRMVYQRSGNVSYFSMYGFMVKKDDNKGC